METQFGGFGNALLNAADCTNLTRQSHLTGKANFVVDGNINVRRKDGTDNGQIGCRIVNLQSPGDIQKDIFGNEAENKCLSLVHIYWSLGFLQWAMLQ